MSIHTKEIYLTHKGLSHLARESKKRRGAGLSEEDILRIPEILKNPHTIYFDKNSDKLNVLYCKDSSSCEKNYQDCYGYRSLSQEAWEANFNKDCRICGGSQFERVY